MTGQAYGPYAFKGGSESACFRALKRCGFTIVAKSESPPLTSLGESFAEVLHLQTVYDSKNSDAMQRRGTLIREIIPTQLRGLVPLLEPVFSAAGYACDIEGSDGVGRKVESTWVRIFDPELSPSATQGWYVVLHFSRLGDYLYSTLGCGATTFSRGSLVDVPDAELIARMRWVRSLANTAKFDSSRFGAQPKLHGNHLSRQFEKAIAFAKAYSPATWKQEEFVADLADLCELLVKVYDAERSGQDPVSGTAEDFRLAQIEREIGSRGGKGQGRGLSKAEQNAVERHAMLIARSAIENAGFCHIRDTSASSCYDFEAIRDNAVWFIECKGTTSSGADVILLTANELRLHQEKNGNTVLVIVSEIRLDRGNVPPSASGGKLDVFDPWDHQEWEFTPTAFRAKRRRPAALDSA